MIPSQLSSHNTQNHSTQAHSTPASNAYVDALKQEYQHVNTLRFSAHFETLFRSYRRETFLVQDHSIVLIGAIIYALFVVTDITFLPADQLIPISVARMLIAGVMFFLYYLIHVAKNAWLRQRIFWVLSFIILMVPLHITTSSLFLPQPYNIMYMLGIVQIYIVVPAILKPHSRICLFTMVSMLLITCVGLFVGSREPIETNNSNINDMLTLYPMAFSSFLAGLVIVSSYLAYAFEKMMRKNWLDHEITLCHAAHLETLSAQLLQLSHKDELTQLANRRYFQDVCENEISRAQESHQPLSLLMLDVDYFKKYNDTYGHQAGDVCLRQVADCLKSQCKRSVDLPVRYGGEEFMVLLPNTHAEGALHMAQSICNAVASLRIPHKASQFGFVTVSIGMTTLVDGEAHSMEHLMSIADHALYDAKTSGRNCCRAHQIGSSLEQV